MKGKKHKPEQIIRKLREADAMLSADKTIGQVCQALEISEQTFHRWRNQYGGMKAEEAKRLKELEGENKRLKKLLAEAELDKAILKEALEHEELGLSEYRKLLALATDKNLMLEEFARQKIALEEQHLAEIRKMMRRG